MSRASHVWRFSTVGGVDRVNLDRGADLVNLDTLDQKLWTALSCPVDGLEIDPKTLKLIDKDNDNKLRVPDILEAVRWITKMVNNADELVERRKCMPLSSINQSHAEGQVLYASAKQIIKYLGKDEAEGLTINDTSDIKAIFSGTAFNGDGVITTVSTDDVALQAIIGNIISTIGSVVDRSGIDGVSENEIQDFFAEAAAYVAWKEAGNTDAENVFPFGDNTAKAYALYLTIKDKVDDYFLRCRLAAFDSESVVTLNTLEERIKAISAKNITQAEAYEEIKNFPIAKIQPNQALPLQAVNPAWAAPIAELKALLETIQPAPVNELSEETWRSLEAKFSAYKAWNDSKAGARVEALGFEPLKNLLASNTQNALLDLVRKDNELAQEASNIISVDKLVRLYCEIYTILSNFVTFSDFYSPDIHAIFQAGTLYFDQRACELCIKVTDIAKHSAMAASSGMCLVYLDCTNKAKDKKMSIVAALTDGDVDNLVVGRNAIFYDNTGVDWDATIVKIIDNPISIRQAFWSPYRKIANLVATQIEKIAASQEEKVTTATTASITEVSAKADTALAQSVKTPPATTATTTATPTTAPATATPAAAEAAKPPFDIAKFAGIFAAMGLAITAIGTMFKDIVASVLALSWWQTPLALLGLMLVLSGPSMFLAWMKLRKRNLAPILDANGWAINAKATINIRFGSTLTHLAQKPTNIALNLNDPFKDPKNPWIPIAIITALVFVVAFILFKFGVFNGLIDSVWNQTTKTEQVAPSTTIPTTETPNN